MDTNKIIKIFNKVIKILSTIVVSFVCLITLFLLFYIISSQLHANDTDYKPGISIYTIVSPSMTPNIEVYDVVVNKKVSSPEKIQVGDIITYKSTSSTSEGMTITHRVVDIKVQDDGTYEFMTQGDNNSEPDSNYVKFDQVIGKEIFIIPKLGKLQFLLANQRGWLFLLIIPIGIYLLREVYRLIDLYSLRKKVVKVTEDTRDEEKEIKKQLETERKEKIKEELQVRELKRNSLIKNPVENASFLEPYSETKLKVEENKYATIKPSIEVERVTEPVTEVVTSVVKKEEKKIDIPTVAMPSKYEILDTDELTSKIKEYDTKLAELDKMMKDMENIQSTKEKKDDFVEVNNYLNSKKIKVKEVKETKNQKRKVNTKVKTKVIPITKDIKIELKSVLPEEENTRLKIERPDSVDIKTQRKLDKENNIKKESKKNLNLNPKTIKKVERNINNKNKTKKNLNLNPNKIQKVNKNIKKQENIQKQTQTNKNKKNNKRIQRKGSFIVIEKIK